MTDHGKHTGVALEKAYQFVLWLVPTVEKFPRSHKILLGDRIQSAALDVLETPRRAEGDHRAGRR